MTLPAFLDQLLFWHWWAIAVGLLVLEALAPGAFFLWMAVAAGVVGALLLLLPQLSWEIQLLAFSLTSVVAIVGWIGWAKAHPAQPASTTLNRRGSEYIGRVYTLTDPVVRGQGKLKLGDTIWTLSGPDCDAGSNIKINKINGNNLIFEVSL